MLKPGMHVILRNEQVYYVLSDRLISNHNNIMLSDYIDLKHKTDKIYDIVRIHENPKYKGYIFNLEYWNSYRDSLIYDESSKIFSKKDIIHGMWVKLKCGDLYLIEINDEINLIKYGNSIPFNLYTDDLRHKEQDEFNVIKVFDVFLKHTCPRETELVKLWERK